ncbi:polysaccharide deacetylase family protein [Empedobacter stercoris]|uniref:polysaccharide deacetylase family protein n=1 Tax=Empedobacter stercoris TaxID=1628248 RepID=UPI0039ECE8BC
MNIRSIFRNLLLNVFGNIKKPKPGIHIINSHFITPQTMDLRNDPTIFENYLSYLSNFADFITLPEAIDFLNKKNYDKSKIYITFTFDDGFEECYSVIAPLLEKYNTRGAFFINANYISSSIEYQKEFHKRVKIYTKNPMSWEQVQELHNRGHLIGSHNLDHLNFGELTNEEIDFQLKENKKILEEKLDYKCEYFAWTYGTFNQFSENALQITKKYHKYIFSGTDFKNYYSFHGQVINRRHQEAFWPKNHINYFLSFNKK